MIRKIVSIDEELCNGCGICTNACHEGAIDLVGGKAKLVSDEYCDGLGDCLPGCPVGAISIIERESGDYSEEPVKTKNRKSTVCACPGSDAKTHDCIKGSELWTWPVQLDLVNVQAPYFNDADLLIAADCTAFAYGDFHKDYIKGRVVLIGCPKLDDAGYYQEKLTEIYKKNNIKSITVVRMSVPCCGGLVFAAGNALTDSGKSIPFNTVIIDTNGQTVNK